jgi:hypothetical protein
VYTREALDEGASLVIAIEPGPNVAWLRRNFQRKFEEKRVIVEALGVWDKDDVLPLYADPLNSGADSFVIRGPNDHVVNVPLTSIDKLVSQLQSASRANKSNASCLETHPPTLVTDRSHPGWLRHHRGTQGY